jgi:hypothetical protein
LINDGYAALAAAPTVNVDINNLKNVERNLAILPGWEREPIILQLRCGFVGGEVADVMGIDEPSSGYSFKAGIAKIGRNVNLDFDTVESLVSKIPNHPLAAKTYESTLALSQIMDDIGKVRKTSGSRWRLPLLVVILVGVGLYLLFWR